MCTTIPCISVWFYLSSSFLGSIPSVTGNVQELTFALSTSQIFPMPIWTAVIITHSLQPAYEKPLRSVSTSTHLQRWPTTRSLPTSHLQTNSCHLTPTNQLLPPCTCRQTNPATLYLQKNQSCHIASTSSSPEPDM